MDFSSFSKVENGCIKAEVIAPEANAYTQYAWYLYEKSLGLVEKRWYGKENTCIFQPAESGNYRVKAFVRNKEREEDEYEKTSQYTNWIVFYATKEIKYENLEQEDFRPAKATIYRIMWNEVPFEFLINYKPDSHQMVVLGTGSVGNHAKPYFSRCSWADDFPGSSIYYFDPSVYLGNSPLCWGYGTNDRWYLEDIATLLYKMLSRLGIAMKDTLFYGSSGGGFMSMILAAKLRGKATVINPQFIVENYDAHHVKSMKEVCLKPGEELLAERTHVLTVFQKEGWFPKLHVIQNVLATEDIRNQITPFLEEISKSSADCTGCLEIEFYTANGGHDIMPNKAQCIRDIEKDLGGTLPKRVDEDVFPENSFLKRMLTASDCAVQNISDSEGNVLAANCDFTGCFLPKPKMYMPLENIEKYANDLMSGKLWVLANIEAMHYSLETLDFGVSYSPLPQTFQLYLQSLNPVQILVLAYEKTGNRDYLEFADSFIRKWEEYASIPENVKNNPFVFNDHAVALRAENLMFLGWVCAKADIWLENCSERLRHLLIQCGSWLNDDRHYTKRHNHGIIQDQALLHLGYVMSSKEWIAHAKERLLIQEQWAFNEEMVHTENSVGYAIIVAEFFEKIGQFLRNNGDPLGDKLAQDMKKTREFEGWSRKPNGVIAHVGDTSTPTNALFSDKEKMRRSSPECHRIFPRAGYYFYRSNRSEQPKDDTWKLLKSGYVQIVHKHADDTSFMLYSKGYEIFVDCGMYGYTKNPIRQYLTSALAHNTVIVDGNSYQVDNKSTHTVGMNSYDFLDAYDRISVFNNAYPGVEFQRDFYSADDLTILMDRVSSESEHIYSQLFHLAEHIEVLKASDREVLLKLADSGFVVRLRQYGDPARLSVIRGDINNPGYGLISRGTNHLDTITTLKFDLTSKTGIFATAITIEDMEGRVRLFDRHEKADQLGYDANEKAFVLGDLWIPCRQALPTTMK